MNLQVCDHSDTKQKVVENLRTNILVHLHAQVIIQIELENKKDVKGESRKEDE